MNNRKGTDMESIPELRKICQATRPSIFGDFLSQWYYKVSIYFTWVCLKLGMSANQVTVLSGVVAVLGGMLLALDNPWLALFGVICFHLFAILDMSDGEVARYRKQGGGAGHYLDWYMHFISSTALLAGLFIASFDSLGTPWLVGLGLMAVIVPILDKSVMTAGWTVICWTRLRDQQKGEDGPCAAIHKDLDLELDKVVQRPFWQRRLIFLILMPLQEHWAKVVLFLLALTDLVLVMLELSFVEYRYWWLLYVGIIGPFYLYLQVRRLVLTPVLQDGYRRLNCPSRPIKLPEDDFL